MSNKRTTNTDCTASEPFAFFSDPVINYVIRETIAAERRRWLAEESAMWERCFGPDAPQDPQAHRDLILSIASARALISVMNTPEQT